MSLSTPQIAAQLDRVLGSDSTAAAVAIRAETRQPWPESLQQRGRRFWLRWCESSLAIREALAQSERDNARDAAEPSGLVVITPLATHELAEDIAARLARGRVYQPEGWDIVRQLFEARATDARLGRYAWMPQALIDAAAQGKYAPVANGFLDLETAWREVLQRFLGLPAAKPDAVALLQWCTRPDSDAALRLLPTATRVDVASWLGEAAGSVGALVLACVEAGRTADAPALGLVCGVVFAEAGEGQVALGQAAVRLERYVGDRHVGVAEGRAWSLAAAQAIRVGGTEAMRGSLERADALLRELRIAEHAGLSDLLPSSLDQRARAFARALQAHVAAPSGDALAQVEHAAERVLAHALATTQAARMECVRMAQRLSRWLLLPAPPVDHLAGGLAWQADDGAFVDWARFRLLGGDELSELSDACGALRKAVIARRDPIDRRFADALQRWNSQSGTGDARVVPVEAVLERVVAPIAAGRAVLVLVMDGLSVSIHRELFDRAGGLGWVEVVPSDVGRPLIGVAALPTVTEVSRTSLLCGRLALGAAPSEKKGFASHTGLLAHSRSDRPPRLFHKGDLSDATNLAPQVRESIADPHQKVVGIVYNAVDDHLSGPDQLHQRWALQDLRLLAPLLREAREAQRVVIITADHGHLLEDGTVQVGTAASTDKVGDRWRPGQDARAPHELGFAGGRVVTADAARAVVCLWGEGTRYAGRKNGYHGGVSPQEVAVPLSVMVPVGVHLSGWQPAPPTQPEWWESAAVVPAAPSAPVAAPVAASRRRTAAAPAAQTSLFAHDDPPPAAESASPQADDWIGQLLSSAVYASQKQLAARVALPDDRMKLLLTVLCERGGKLTRAALAQRLGLPEGRLAGLLSAVRRILNVDQAAVLSVDESEGTVSLNRTLLMLQFRIGDSGAKR